MKTEALFRIRASIQDQYSRQSGPHPETILIDMPCTFFMIESRGEALVERIAELLTWSPHLISLSETVRSPLVKNSKQKHYVTQHVFSHLGWRPIQAPFRDSFVWIYSSLMVYEMRNCSAIARHKLRPDLVSGVVYSLHILFRFLYLDDAHKTWQLGPGVKQYTACAIF